MNASRTIRFLAVIAGAACIAGAPSCAGAQTTVTSPRVIAIAPIPRGGPPLTPAKVGAALNLARAAGVNGDQLSSKWIDLEPTAGNYQLTDFISPLAVLGNQFKWKLMFTLALIDTTSRQMPPDLAGLAWDDPQVISRFHALIDAMAPYIQSTPELEYFSVGNEVDVYFQAHPTELAAYQTFFDDAVAYLHTKAPALKIGVTTTFSGTIGSANATATQLDASSDVIILTYYPLGADFIPNGPASPLTDFPQMVNFAAGKPVILQEVGYPSSKRLKSSPKEQRQFVQNVFAAWDQNSAAIPFLSYFGMHDFGDKWCDSLLVYYGIPDPDHHFESYLCSLGLRNVGGAPKPGWKAFVKGVDAVNAANQSIAP